MSLTNLWNSLVVWVKAHWRVAAAVVAALLAHLVVMSVGVLLVMVLLGVPAGLFVKLLCLALVFGFVDRRAVAVSTWTCKKVHNTSDCCEKESCPK